MRTFSIIYSNYTMQLFAWEGTPKACKKFLGNREVIGTIEAQNGTDESANAEDAYSDEEFMPMSAADRKERAAAEVEELKAGQAMINGLRGMRLSSNLDFTETGVDVSADMELPKK